MNSSTRRRTSGKSTRGRGISRGKGRGSSIRGRGRGRSRGGGRGSRGGGRGSRPTSRGGGRGNNSNQWSTSSSSSSTRFHINSNGREEEEDEDCDDDEDYDEEEEYDDEEEEGGEAEEGHHHDRVYQQEVLANAMSTASSSAPSSQEFDVFRAPPAYSYDLSSSLTSHLHPAKRACPPSSSSSSAAATMARTPQAAPSRSSFVASVTLPVNTPSSSSSPSQAHSTPSSSSSATSRLSFASPAFSSPPSSSSPTLRMISSQSHSSHKRSDEWKIQSLGSFAVKSLLSPSKLMVIAQCSQRNLSSANLSHLLRFVEEDLPTFLKKQAEEAHHLYPQIYTLINGRPISFSSPPASALPPAVYLQLELQDNDLNGDAIKLLMPSLLQLIQASFSSSSSSPSSSSRQPLIHLTALKLWQNQLEDTACAQLAQLLIAASEALLPLEELHLSHNQITEKGAILLFKALISSLSSFPPLFPLWLRLEWNLIQVQNKELLSLIEDYDPKNKKKPEKAKNKKKKKIVRAEAEKDLNSRARRQLKKSQLRAEEASRAEDTSSSSSSFSATGSDIVDGKEIGIRAVDEEELFGTIDHEGVLLNEGEEDEEKNNAAGEKDDKEVEEHVADELQEEKLNASFAELRLHEQHSLSSSSSSSSPSKVQVCYASDRTRCSVRMCCFGSSSAAVHLYCWSLQHARFQESGLLKQLSLSSAVAAKKLKSKRISSSPSVAITLATQSKAEAASSSSSVEEEKHNDSHVGENCDASLSSSTSAASIPFRSITSHSQPTIPSSISSSSFSSSSSFASLPISTQPLVIFLDTNVVFAMISASKQLSVFHWNNLYQLAASSSSSSSSPPLFGSDFADENERVYIVLSSAVLHEIDQRKEFNKKMSSSSSSSSKALYEHHQNMRLLSQQIKQQFQLTLPDPSQSFLARCMAQGWLQSLSLHDQVNSVLFDASSLDIKNISNDRRIVNAARFWQQQINQHHVVLLLSEDSNIRHELNLSGDLDCASVKLLDQGLKILQDEFASRNHQQQLPLTSGVFREALRIGLQQAQTSAINSSKNFLALSSSSPPSVQSFNATPFSSGVNNQVDLSKPIQQLEMNVYEALKRTQITIQAFRRKFRSATNTDEDIDREEKHADRASDNSFEQEEDEALLQEDELDHLNRICDSLILNAPTLLSTLRRKVVSSLN